MGRTLQPQQPRSRASAGGPAQSRSWLEGGRVWPSLPALLTCKDPGARIPASTWEVQPGICLACHRLQNRRKRHLVGVGGSGCDTPLPERAARRALRAGAAQRSLRLPSAPARLPAAHRTGPPICVADMEDGTATARRLLLQRQAFLLESTPGRQRQTHGPHSSPHGTGASGAPGRGRSALSGASPVSRGPESPPLDCHAVPSSLSRQRDTLG